MVAVNKKRFVIVGIIIMILVISMAIFLSFSEAGAEWSQSWVTPTNYVYITKTPTPTVVLNAQKTGCPTNMPFYDGSLSLEYKNNCGECLIGSSPTPVNIQWKPTNYLTATPMYTPTYYYGTRPTQDKLWISENVTELIGKKYYQSYTTGVTRNEAIVKDYCYGGNYIGFRSSYFTQNNGVNQGYTSNLSLWNVVNGFFNVKVAGTDYGSGSGSKCDLISNNTYPGIPTMIAGVNFSGCSRSNYSQGIKKSSVPNISTVFGARANSTSKPLGYVQYTNYQYVCEGGGYPVPTATPMATPTQAFCGKKNPEYVREDAISNDGGDAVIHYGGYPDSSIKQDGNVFEVNFAGDPTYSGQGYELVYTVNKKDVTFIWLYRDLHERIGVFPPEILGYQVFDNMGQPINRYGVVDPAVQWTDQGNGTYLLYSGDPIDVSEIKIIPNPDAEFLYLDGIEFIGCDPDWSEKCLYPYENLFTTPFDQNLGHVYGGGCTIIFNEYISDFTAINEILDGLGLDPLPELHLRGLKLCLDYVHIGTITIFGQVVPIDYIITLMLGLYVIRFMLNIGHGTIK